MNNSPLPVCLTDLVHCGGCASKAPIGQLASILAALPPSVDPRVLVDTRTSDDAGVFALTDEIALVQTVDFFTPVVDDAYTWGAIAATNALSDVYAMGGTPVTALNVVAFPVKTLPLEVLAEVLRGAADKCREAGVAILGGHTVEDDTPKFGLCVTGVVHPGKVVTNAGGQIGDRLVLTKPLGLGIVNSGVKKKITSAATYALAVEVMTTLNRAAAEAMGEVGVHAATDVTGFGLVGHLSEMCGGAGLGAEIDFSALPLLPDLTILRRQGATTSAPQATFAHLDNRLVLDSNMTDIEREILADPQTSGGLLIAVPATREAALHRALQQRNVQWAKTIGQLVGGRQIVVKRSKETRPQE